MGTSNGRLPACFRARSVVIALRGRRETHLDPVHYRVVCPAEWSRSQFLAYCRAVHVDEVVWIVRWSEKPCLWLTNPLAFDDYRGGVVKKLG